MNYFSKNVFLVEANYIECNAIVEMFYYKKYFTYFTVSLGNLNNDMPIIPSVLMQLVTAHLFTIFQKFYNCRLKQKKIITISPKKIANTSLNQSSSNNTLPKIVI